MVELDGLKSLEEKLERLLDRYAELEARSSGSSGAMAEKDGEIERLRRELDEARRVQEAVRARVQGLIERVAKFDVEA